MRTSSTGDGDGFTLVETIIVIVLVAVLATMAIPRLSGATGAGRLRESARRLAVTARYARDFAVTRRSNCRLVIDATEHRYALTFQSDPQHRPNEFLPMRTGIGKGERLTEPLRFEKVWIVERARPVLTTSRTDCITFDAMGQADPAVVAITDGRCTYSMLVAPSSGKTRLVEGPVDELPNDRQDLDE